MARKPQVSRGAMQRSLEGRRWTVDRVESMGVHLFRCAGKTLVRGSGEVAVDVYFPVTFTEEPVMTFGGALDLNEPLEDGNFPTVSCVVAKFLKKEKQQGEDAGLYYVGATLAIVTTGRADQFMNVHWVAEARAFQNPDTFDIDSETTDTTL